MVTAMVPDYSLPRLLLGGWTPRPLPSVPVPDGLGPWKAQWGLPASLLWPFLLPFPDHCPLPCLTTTVTTSPGKLRDKRILRSPQNWQEVGVWWLFETFWSALNGLQDQLHGPMIRVAQDPMLRRSSILAYCSALANLKFLINFEQGTLHVYFAFGPEHYVAGSDGLVSSRSLVWKGRVKRP